MAEPGRKAGIGVGGSSSGGDEARGPDQSAPSGNDRPVLRASGEAPPGRWTRTVPIEHVEAELSDLWCEVSRAGGPTSRSLMSNLIVYAEGDRSEASAEESEEVSRLHPSRVIAVDAAAGAAERAEIAIQTHGQGISQFGVEHVAITVGDRDAVPSLLRRLTIGDLPTSIWWAAASLPMAKTVHYLAQLGRQFVYDSSVWPRPVEAIRTMAPLALQSAGEIDVADLTWRRLKPLRYAIVQAIDPDVLQRPLGHLHALTIETGPAQEATAWLLAAWIASRLGWQPVAREIRESAASVAFNAPGGRAVLTIRNGADETLRASFETDALPGAAALEATHAGEEIVVRYGWEVPPLTMMAPQRSRAEMLAAELRNLFVDAYLHDALRLIARIEAL